MSALTPPNGPEPSHRTLDAADLSRVNDLHDEFEAAWSEGRPPRIEDFLREAPAHVRPRLLAELLLTELNHRRAQGQRPAADDYRGRFPGLEAVLETVFAGSDEHVVGLPRNPGPGTSGRPMLDRYEILEKLGTGGMGVVYKARHRAMGRVVAMKVLTGFALAAETSRRRFRQEVRALARLTHPNIVVALDAEYDGDTPFLVMEYVEGVDLARLVASRGPLPVDEVIDLISQAAAGLDHAHRQGIIHRGVKPSNLLLATDGAIKVLDLGLAKLHASVEDAGPTLTYDPTQPGIIMGTVAYMAPEQAADAAGVDVRADVYSLGCTLHYLLTGRPPFRGKDDVGTLIAHRESPIPSLRRGQPEIPEALDQLFARMIAKDPAERPSSMAEIVAGLDPPRSLVASATGETQDGVTVRYHQADSRIAGLPSDKAERGTPMYSWLTALAFLAMTVVTLIGWIQYGRPPVQGQIGPAARSSVQHRREEVSKSCRHGMIVL